MLWGMFQMFMPPKTEHKGTCTCTFKGCKKTTREGKPFCSPHVENSPYIKKILAEIKKRDKEERKLNLTRGNISQDGFFVREALLLLRTRDFTAKAFSRRLDISHHAASRLIAMMVKWGYAKQTRTTRGGSTISGCRGRDLEDGI